MNAWIALTRLDPTFSHTFLDLEYACDIIEPPLFVDGHDLQPDIVLTSPRLDHSIVVDCKSNTIDHEQLDRYLSLEDREDVLIEQGAMDEVPAEDLEAELCLSSLSDISTEETPDEFALVHFEHSPSSEFVVWNLDDYKFDLDELREQFPINGEPSQQIPVSYYPYDIHEEDREMFITHVLRLVISLVVKQDEFSV